jgi:Xaa-Pro aminopeptidase
MARDEERIGRVRQALRDEGLDALACALPVNVLLLTGYWPVVGTSVVLAGRDGPTVLLVPADEQELAQRGWADEVHTFEPASLADLRTAVDALRQPLTKAVAALRLDKGKVGLESGSAFEPASYAAMHLYGDSLRQLLAAVAPSATLTPADGLLTRLRSVKTPREVEHVRTACRVVGQAFAEGAEALRPGLTEAEAANLFQAPLRTEGLRLPGVARAGGIAFCMSGPNSARAAGAYACTRDRRLQPGDLVLLHCNSCVDGFWTDVTRTYCLAPADERRQRMYAAVQAARSAALAAVRPGVRAAAVDQAARSVLVEHGFGPAFKHSTGHGVGFAAIDHNARPRLHPASDEVLEEGMVFNVEPAIYLDGFGGLRHCDVAAVTASGAAVLTPFQATAGELILAAGQAHGNLGRAAHGSR